MWRLKWELAKVFCFWISSMPSCDQWHFERSQTESSKMYGICYGNIKESEV